MATWRHPSNAEFSVPKGRTLVTGPALDDVNESAINNFRTPHPPVEQIPPNASGL